MRYSRSRVEEKCTKKPQRKKQQQKKKAFWALTKINKPLNRANVFLGDLKALPDAACSTGERDRKERERYRQTEGWLPAAMAIRLYVLP